MAKSVKLYNLEQGSGDNITVVPVSVKTTTPEYFRKLIRDYRRRGDLDSREVRIVPVIPLFN